MHTAPKSGPDLLDTPPTCCGPADETPPIVLWQDDKDYKLCSFKYIMFNDLSQAASDGLMAPPPPDALHAQGNQGLINHSARKPGL